jgi:hypothetical protein
VDCLSGWFLGMVPSLFSAFYRHERADGSGSGVPSGRR